MADTEFHSDAAFATDDDALRPRRSESAAPPNPGASRISTTPGYLLYAMTAFAALLIGWHTRNDAAMVSRILGDEAASRAEIETLADRMWELQESEERFRG